MAIDLKLAERVMRAIADEQIAPRGAMELHSTLDGDLGFDSLDRVHAAVTIEEEFALPADFEFGVEVINAWLTIGDIAQSAQEALTLRGGRG